MDRLVVLRIVLWSFVVWFILASIVSHPLLAIAILATAATRYILGQKQEVKKTRGYTEYTEPKPTRVSDW